LRFSYAATSGSTVYEMPDLHSFINCDFTKAYLWGAADKGTPHFDYVIKDDHSKKVYYFASKNHCAHGQKVAVEVVDDYANNALQCKNMGAGSSRIQHCDCNHQLKGSTLIDPCHTAFANACLADTPSDTSCCPAAGASYAGGKYVKGGTCVPKSKKQSMQQMYLDTMALCKANATKCAEFEAMAACPSRYNPAKYDARCNMQKTLKKCGNATGAMVETCRTDMNWIVANMAKSSTSTTGTTGGTTASTKVEGSITMVAAGLTKAQVEAASKTALAEHFAVTSGRITTTATETRRLGVDGNDRRLAGTWTIAYNFLALPAEVVAINTKVATAKSAPDAFKAALATKFKAGLKKAGVSAAVADALVVNSATSVATTTSATTGGTTGSTASGAKRANFDGVFKAFAVVLLLLRTLTSN